MRRKHDELDELIDRLHKIERLFEGTDHHGEREAARLAMERVKAAIAQKQRDLPKAAKTPPPPPPLPPETQFSFSNRWSRRMFLYLLKKYGIEGYRYPRQRHNTVMARIPVDLRDGVIWPLYQRLDQELQRYLEATADEVMRRAFGPEVEAEL